MSDESYIQLAVEIAKKGIGKVSPNPLVGCVIIKDGKIIGAGYHDCFGENHAEINALLSARESVEGSTLYVNLEPCSHFGKTPPCVDAIIENKIKRVVVGTLDMNPAVSGSGIKKLMSAGIEVKVGILEDECIKLNKFFFKYITKKIPYITLKAAQTLDGKIADLNGDSKWISSLESRKYVHNLRAAYDAVLIGKGTVEKDNPNLTVRLTEGRNPKRIIVDSKLSLDPSKKLFVNNKDGNLFVVTSRKSLEKVKKIKKLTDLGVRLIPVREDSSGGLSVTSILKELGKHQIASLLVEGGCEIYTSFIKKKAFDELQVFISPKLMGEGLPFIGNIGVNEIRHAVKLKIDFVERFGDDLLISYTK